MRLQIGALEEFWETVVYSRNKCIVKYSTQINKWNKLLN